MNDKEKIQYWVSGLIIGIVMSAYAAVIAVCIKASNLKE